MVIKPKVRGFICTTAHPVGCAKNVEQQSAYAAAHPVENGPKRVLVVGASTGYGLASRIAAAFGCGAHTVGVSLERPASGNRTGTAGWYNNAAFDKLAAQAGLVNRSICADAFSAECKAQAIEAVRALPGGQVDLVVYSVAAPRRTDPLTGESYSSVIKPVGGSFRGRSIDTMTGQLQDAEILPATPEEVAGTIKVMGGEDWLLWMQALAEAGVLAPGCGTLAYTYIGPVLTHAIYKDGTIGKAKEDLEQKGREIDELLAPLGGKALVSVNKALVTQASSAIPVVPLYISLLYKLMKAEGSHEGCIQQMVRLFQRLYTEAGGDWSRIPTDEAGRIRLDDWEMKPHLQQRIETLWRELDQEAVAAHADLEGYREDFYGMFGFGLDGVDYEADVPADLI